MRKRLISILLFIFMAFVWFPGTLTLQAEDKHVIAGFGPVYGNFVQPTACKIVGDTIFVSDQYGISSFSLPDKKFIARYQVDLDSPLYDKALRDPDVLGYSLFSGCSYSNVNFSNSPFQVVKTIESDSSNNLYISALNGITHLNKKGGMIQLIPYPQEIITTKENEKTIVMFTMAGDKIYLLVQYEYQPLYYDEEYHSEQTIYILNIEGKILNKIKLKTDDQIVPEFFCFKFLQHKGMFLMAGLGIDYNRETIYLFDEEGSQLYSFIIENLSYYNNPLDLISEDSFICLTSELIGSDSIENQVRGNNSPSYNNEIKLFRLLFQENELTVKWEKSWKHESWGDMCLSFSASPKRIGIITESAYDSEFDYQVNIVDFPNNYYTIGKATNGAGQMYKSLTYTVDEEGNLYTTNFRAKTINVFNSTGEFQNTIEIDTSIVSRSKGIHDIISEPTPTITEMCIESGSLYIANITPNTVSCYNLETKEWKSIYNYNNDSYDYNFYSYWIDMHIVGDDIYLLDAYADENGMPCLYKINKDLEMSPVILPLRFSNAYEQYYAGFEIDDQHLYILDGLNHKIQDWNFPNPDKKRTIRLENTNETLYTSFCLLSSGDFILADPIHDQIIRTNKKGKTISKWGTRISLVIGMDKSEYQTNPDGLNLPLRVKEQNNILCINDFMNYRYHIITPPPIPPSPTPPPKVTLTNFVGLKDISVFQDHEQTIEIAIESEFLAHFQMKTDQDWIQIQDPSFTSETKELHITLLGSKMKPWVNNFGYLSISCEEANLNDQNEIKVEISVDTVGKKMTIDLNTNSVNFDGRITQPPADQCPIVENNRTFLPFRFISEGFFDAMVEWDNANQEVTILTNQHTLKLKVGSKSAWLDGKEIKMDVAPFIRHSRVFVPLRFFGESFGAKVDYESTTRIITIMYPSP